jgi:hypothetical protein
MSIKRVLAIVLNYNGKKFTNDLYLRTIESLKNQNYQNLEIIVADNNSNDGSVAEINQKFPDIRIIRLKKNRATMGYNAGIDVFMKGNYDFLFLSNNDIIYENDFIKNMIDFCENNSDAGLITPRIMMLSDKNIYNSTGIVINKSGFAWDRNFGDKESDIGIIKSSEVASASGGAMFCTREAVKAVKKFDPIYYAYYEDVDLSVRLRRCTDLKIFYNSEALCYHSFSMSWGVSPMKEFYMIRNRYVFVIIHFQIKMMLNSIRFMYFSVRHPQNNLQKKIFLSLFFLMPFIIYRRIGMSFNKPLSKTILENFAGLPSLSNKKSANSA